MKRISAVIERADIYKISDLFRIKPSGLRFNETDALVMTVRSEDGRKINSIFYFSLKPDGTFEEEILGTDAAKSRRHRLAAFLRHYKIAEDVRSYNLKDRVGELKGVSVEAVPIDDDMAIYVP